MNLVVLTKRMASLQKFSSNDVIDDPVLEDEVDLKQIFDTLYRNKRIIAIFSLSCAVLSGLIAFNTKRVWQGEFQIVLESSNPRSLLSTNQNLVNLTGIGARSNQLTTQVGILKSPSVLLSIFEFVKTEKSLKNDPIEKLRFKNWKDKSLYIELEKGTSILNITYRDKDKDLILPVLKKISSTYQIYSGRKRMRNIELGINYFEDQIEIYKSKSFDSLSKVQQFAIDQDLSIIKGEAEIDKEIETPSAINIEAIRVEAANQIRVIDQQLLQIEDLKDESEQIMYVASTIPALDELSIELKEIDSRLAKLRVTYQEYDKSIQALLEERIFLIDLLKRQVKGFLIAQKANAKARLKSAERPKGVLTKYRQLLSDAAKDRSTLNKLENEYRIVLLEKARREDPWQLITAPTLLPYPVAPNKKRMLALGLLGGVFVGSGFALISDKAKDIIFSMNEMKSLGEWPLLCEILLDQKKSWSESLELLASGPLSDSDGSIAIIVVGEIDDSFLTELNQSLGQCLKSRQLKISKDIIEATKCSNLIVLTALGITRRRELIEIKRKLLWQKRPVIGLLAFNKSKSKT